MKLFLSLLLIFIACFNLNAQTVIDYANFTGSGCVFTGSTDVPATINGTSGNIKHQTSVGEVDYGSTTHVLYFQSNSTNSVGSEYKIEYTFKPNYSYSIVVNTRSINSSGATPSLRLKITNSASSSAICSGPQTIDGTTTGTLILTKVIPNGNFADQTYTFNSVPGASNIPYLTLANLPSGNGGAQTIEISKITITETAPPVSFTLPFTTNVTCGSTSPITFTVNTASNPNNLTITDYTWNLGTTPNGWLYNGNPASATVSTGTTSSITLTPNCGSTLSSISATVTAGGNQYNTNQSAINVTTPSLSISGSNTLCSTSETYSVSGLSCNASVTWSASPANIVSLSCTSCSSTTLTKTGNGNITLTAAVTSPTCSNLTSPTKTVLVGSNGTWDGVISGLDGDQSCTGSEQYPWVNYLGEGSSYEWSVLNGTRDYDYSLYNDINYQTDLTFFNPGYYEIQAKATTPCGDVYYATAWQQVDYCFSYFSIAPSPATSDITVYVDGQKLKKLNVGKSSDQKIEKIIIIDKLGNALMQRSYPSDTKKATINISSLNSELYIVKIYNGKKWTSLKFMKK